MPPFGSEICEEIKKNNPYMRTDVVNELEEAFNALVKSSEDERLKEWNNFSRHIFYTFILKEIELHRFFNLHNLATDSTRAILDFYTSLLIATNIDSDSIVIAGSWHINNLKQIFLDSGWKLLDQDGSFYKSESPLNLAKLKVIGTDIVLI